MVSLQRFSILALCVSSAACAETTTQATQQDNNAAQSTMRTRPRRSAARRALREAAERARECLPITVDRAEVSGSFAGTTGRYSVESVLGENIGREQRTCVRAAFEAARVPPFRADRFELAQVVSRLPAVAGAANGSGDGDGDSDGASSGGQASATTASNTTTTGTAATAATTGAATTAATGTSAATTTTAASTTTATTTSATSTSSGTTGTTATTATTAGSPDVIAVAQLPGAATSTGTGAATTAGTGAATSAGAGAAASGTIDQGAVVNVIRSRTNVFRTCYQNQLAREPQLRARVRVRFVVDAAGLVSAASSTAVAESGDPERVGDLARCLEGVVRGTTFPARPGGAPAEVSMPFVFAQGTPGAAVSSATNTTAAASTAGTAATATAIATPGQIDRGRVEGTIRARMGTLSSCYTRAAAQEASLAGRVTVRFVVNTDGRVVESRAQATTSGGTPTRMNEVAQCVQGAFYGFVFAVPTGGPAAVTLPLDFGPSS